MLSLILGIVSALVIGGIGWAKLSPDSMGTLFWFVIFMLFNSASYLVKYYIVVKKRSFFLMGYGFLIYLVQFLLVVVPLMLGHSLKVSMQCLAGWGLLKFIFQLIYIRKDLFPLTWDRSLFGQQFRLAWPLMLALLLSSYSPMIDALLVETYLSDDLFAIFQYGAKEFPLIMLLANAMSTTQSGDVMEALKEGKPESAYSNIRSTATKYMHLLFPLSLVLLLSSDWLYRIAYAGNFPDSPRIFDLYLLLVIPRLLFPQTIIKGHLRNKVLTVVSGVELVINVVLSIVFLFLFKAEGDLILALQGIALATLIAYVFEKIMLVTWCRKKLGVRLKEYANLRVWFVYSLVFAAFFVVKFLYMISSS